MVAALDSFYGDAAVEKYRQSIAALNEARRDKDALWWRAAQNVEDDFKNELNGGSDVVTDDEIARESDESTRAENKEAELQNTADSEGVRLFARLEAFHTAKRRLGEPSHNAVSGTSPGAC